MSTVKVTQGSGSPFEVEADSLTQASVFLQTDKPFEYGELLTVEILGLAVQGNVVYIQEQAPLGVGLQLKTPPAAAEVFKAGFPKDEPAPPGAPSTPAAVSSAPAPAVSSAPAAALSSVPATGSADEGIDAFLSALNAGVPPPVGSVPPGAGTIPPGMYAPGVLPPMPDMMPSSPPGALPAGVLPPVPAGAPGVLPPAPPGGPSDAPPAFGAAPAPATSAVPSVAPAPVTSAVPAASVAPVTGAVPAAAMTGPPPAAANMAYPSGVYPSYPSLPYGVPPGYPPAGYPSPVSDGVSALMADLQADVGEADGPGLHVLGPDGRITATSALDAYAACSMMLAGRPLVARGAAVAPESVLTHDGTSLALTLMPLVPGLVGFVAKDEDALRKVAAVFHAAMGGGAVETPEEPEPDPEDRPVLGGDGRTVGFSSFKQFVVQFRVSMAQGALIVRATGLAPGTSYPLSLDVPGAESIDAKCTVAFQGEGTIGFMFDDPVKVGAKLEKLAKGPAPKPRAPSISGAPRPATISNVVSASIGFRGKLKCEAAVKDIYEFNEKRPKKLADCNGWLVRILDHMLSEQAQVVCTIRHEDRKLRLWLHEGCVVFTSMDGASEQDRLGRLLVLQKKISRGALHTALKRAEEQGQPIGRTLVGMGELESAALNSALRAQIMDRVFAARTWEGAQLEVAAWSDPEIESGLVLTSGKAIIASLLREELRRAHFDHLEEFATPFLNRLIEVDLTQSDPAFGLKKKERRFYEKAAGRTDAMRDLPKATAVSMPETWRLVTLGHALGFVDIGREAKERTQEERDGDTLVAVRDKMTDFKKASHFEVLGVHWTSPEGDLKKGHEAQVAEYEQHKKSTSPHLRKAAQEILDMIEKAYAVLRIPGRRISYRNKLIAEDERKRAVENMHDQAQLLMLKEHYHKTEVLLRCAKEIFSTSRGDKLMSELRNRDVDA